MPYRHVLWERVYDQLRKDFNGEIRDMVRKDVRVTTYSEHAERRQYHTNTYPLRGIVLPGGGIISVEESMKKDFVDRFQGTDANFLLQVEHLLEIQRLLLKHGNTLVELHHVFLPDCQGQDINEELEIRWIEKGDLWQFQENNKFPNALIFNPLFDNQYAAAAIVKGEIVGLAGASEDCKEMWQIGVDVEPHVTGRRIATTLVSLVRKRIEEEGKIPFYGTISSHIISQKIAIAAGFSPAWVEIYAQPRAH